jgi:xylan 1,4-beta-xylosidase
MLTNFALPRHPITVEQVSFSLKSTMPVKSASIQRIDLEHANAKRHWEQFGKPEYLSNQIVAQLQTASELKKQNIAIQAGSGGVSVSITMPPQSVAAIQFDL